MKSLPMLRTFRILFLLCLTMAACSMRDADRGSSFETKTSPVPTAAPQQTPASFSIRSIDFGNFTYPAEPVCPGPLKSVTLKNGEFGDGENCERIVLAYLDYGDATGDGRDDAIAVLSSALKASAIPYYVYIYALDNEKPKLLWAFGTGDRADGGLRQVLARGGELTIDLYGKQKIIGSNLFADDGMTGGDCCPTHFTRTRYEWQRNVFTQKAPGEVLPNPSGGAPVLMPRYGISRASNDGSVRLMMFESELSVDDETLARVRKLSRNTPAVQVNIAGSGGQQVNVRRLLPKETWQIRFCRSHTG